MALNIGKLVRALKTTDTIITPRLNDFLLSYGDGAMADAAVAEKMLELMTVTPRERSASFSASSAGACERRQLLGFLGAAQGVVDPQLQNIFNDGKWRHMRWQAMLLMAGLLLDVEHTLRWNNMNSVGTMDGLGVVYDDHPKSWWRGLEYGFELKGVSGYQFAKFKNDGPKEAHLNQVHRYFLMSGLPLFIIIYEDKSTQDWIEWVIEPDPKRIEEQQAEVERLNLALDREKLPDMLPNCKKRTGPEWSDCPFAGGTGPCVASRTWPARSLTAQWDEERRQRLASRTVATSGPEQTTEPGTAS